MQDIILIVGVLLTAGSLIVGVTWKIAGNYHTKENLADHVDECQRRYAELSKDIDEVKLDFKNHRTEVKQDLTAISNKIDSFRTMVGERRI